jgi:hypothetical protein
MLTTITALALLLQVPAPTPPTPPVRPKVKVRVAPHAPRWHERDGEATRDTTIAVRQGQRLEVNNFGGSITVTASRDDRLRVSATSGSDPFRLDAGAITVSVESVADEGFGPGEAALSIEAPAWMELELSGNEVDIRTTGMRGAIQASTVEGSVAVDGAEGNVELNSVEGDVTVANAKGRVELSTVEGRVTLTNITGSALSAESVDGDIELIGVQSPTVTVSSVDGDITWRGALLPTGTYHLGTHDGDILLQLPGEPDVAVSVETYDGSIESDWPITLTRSGSRRTTFTLGSGRARLELSSFDGTISLKRGTGR